MAFDLHTHTVFSDGTTTAAENAALARAGGMRGLALTDHDTVDGWEPAADACRREGLEFVPGVELSTELHLRSVHLLGYWVEPSPALLAECDRLRHERTRRAREIVGRLDELGQRVAWEDVVARAGAAPIGRPHIAAAMVDAGLVATLDEAFDRWLADDGPAWVPKHALDPVDGVRLIRDSGGVAVLAHPGAPIPGGTVTPDLVADLVTAGLAGIEADTVAHDAATSVHWRRVAAEHDLVVTGSSDFHGRPTSFSIGARSTTAQALERLRERRGVVGQGGA